MGSEGLKTSILGRPHAAAHVIFAKTDPAAGARGVSAFLVPADTPGLALERFSDVGWKPIGRAAISLDNVFVPDSNLMGQEGGAFKMVMEL